MGISEFSQCVLILDDLAQSSAKKKKEFYFVLNTNPLLTFV